MVVEDVNPEQGSWYIRADQDLEYKEQQLAALRADVDAEKKLQDLVLRDMKMQQLAMTEANAGSSKRQPQTSTRK